MERSYLDEGPFKAGLIALREVSEDDLRAAVTALPEDLRERLAEGPRPYRYACGVCETFGRDFYLNAEPDITDPKWLVWAFHEVPKAAMTHAGQLHYGALANETYQRCLTTYRAAGWDGEAGRPDA